MKLNSGLKSCTKEKKALFFKKKIQILFMGKILFFCNNCKNQKIQTGQKKAFIWNIVLIFVSIMV